MLIDVYSGKNVTIIVKSIQIKIEMIDVINFCIWNKKLWSQGSSSTETNFDGCI